MELIRLKTWYNQGGRLIAGKTYIAYKADDFITLSANGEAFSLDKGMSGLFMKTIGQIGLEKLDSEYSRTGMVFMQWQLDYNGTTVSGTNKTPKQISRLIDVFHFFTDSYPTQPDILHEAVLFATSAHAGQVRKGTDVPYITHPMEVCQLLTEMKAGRELKIAALLHDVVEDTPVTLQQVEDKFGKEVARLVASHTEEKGKSWHERKQSAIDRVKTGDMQVAMLIMADKISNLKSMLSDYLVVGEQLWQRFGSTKEMQSVHNSRLIDALHYLSANPDTAGMYNYMKQLYEELYVDFYIDRENSCIYYDKCAVAKGAIHRGEHTWQAVEEIPAGALAVSRKKAEKLISLWQKTDNL